MRVIVVVDHLRIGGLERLALDQMYEMSDCGIDCILISLNSAATRNNPNFLAQESEKQYSKRISIYDAPPGKLAQIVFLWRSFRSYKPELVISHTLPAVFISRLIRPLTMVKYRINTVIHQLPSLSDKRQRIKRFFYAQFADYLFAYSIAVQRDWNRYSQSNYLNRWLFRKEIQVLRNGIYLKRLSKQISKAQIEEQEIPIAPRLIFIGRLVSWKGIEKFEEIFRSIEDLNPKLLVFSPTDDSQIREGLNKLFRNNARFVVGSTLADYDPKPGDIHVYPVDYGPNAIFIESISLNCLEMAAMGIKSMVTYGGCETWPELIGAGVLVETKWGSREAIRQSVLKSLRNQVTQETVADIAELITIRRNISEHLGIPL